MNAEEIRVALEDAVGIPEEALRAAVANAAELAPAVIAVAQNMADGRMPLLHEERLLRFGLHALSVAREASLCPAFLALLRRPQLELEWLFGEHEVAIQITRLILGLYDGDDAAVRAVVADPEVSGDARGALLEALARLVWEGRAPRDGLLELLDRVDREELAEPGSWAWYGWQSAICLLGLTDWTDRVERAWQSDRDIPTFDREVDRVGWRERIGKAAASPEDVERFIEDGVTPFDDPARGFEWSADPPSGPDDALNDDELVWLEVMLWRRVGTDTMCLEWADGFLTALAVGPKSLPPGEYLPAILGGTHVFETPEHDACVAQLLTRHLAAIERMLADGDELRPWIEPAADVLIGGLWASGYLDGMHKRGDAWQPLLDKRHLVDRLIMPVLALADDPSDQDVEHLTYPRRVELIGTLPDILAATWAFWHGEPHGMLEVRQARARKVGRNDPCPCGSGKKYKRCCGAVA